MNREPWQLLSVILVTWNGMRYLPRCLAALVPQLPPNAEIVHVDNGSTDGTVAWVREHYPQVRVISLTQNTGFAGGVAVGLQHARGDVILLINDDAFIEDGFIEAMLQALRLGPTIGAVAGVLLFEHRPELVASAGIEVRRDGVATDLWLGCAVAVLPEQPVEIFGASGGAVLYRRSALEQVGGIDRTFFAYLEDVDLAWRLRLCGWSTVVAPQARACHVYSATGGQGSPFKQRLLARNRVRSLIRTLPRWLFVRNALSILLYDLLAIGYGLFRGQHQMVAGRIEGLSELPRLLPQRHAIQQQRSVAVRELSRWLVPAPWPWQTLREAQALERLLRNRPLGNTAETTLG